MGCGSSSIPPAAVAQSPTPSPTDTPAASHTSTIVSPSSRRRHVRAESLPPLPQGVMISYSHSDRDFASELELQLTAAGFSAWLDSKIQPGEDWRGTIARAIERSFAVVFIMSPNSVLSKYCKEEIYYAVQTNRILFPIIYKDAWKDLKGGLKLLLQRLQFIDFSTGTMPGLSQLIQELRAGQQRLHECAQQIEQQWRMQELEQELDDGAPLDDDEYDEDAATINNERDAVFSPATVDHAPSTQRPADVYICFEDADKRVLEQIQQHLVSHGFSVYYSLRKKRNDSKVVDHRASPMLAAHERNASFSTLVLEAADQRHKHVRTTSEMSRPSSRHASPIQAVRQLSVQTTSAHEDAMSSAPTHQHSSHSLDSTTTIPRTKYTPIRLPTHDEKEKDKDKEKVKSIEHDSDALSRHSPSEDDGCLFPGEDYFDLNAAHIDASSYIILIASVASLKSPDCTDELHYAYEVNKPLLQIRTHNSGELSRALFSGSMGMMLQRVPIVQWSGDEWSKLSLIFHVSKNKLALHKAELARKQDEEAIALEALARGGTPLGKSRTLLNRSMTSRRVGSSLKNTSKRKTIGAFMPVLPNISPTVRITALTLHPSNSSSHTPLHSNTPSPSPNANRRSLASLPQHPLSAINTGVLQHPIHQSSSTLTPVLNYNSASPQSESRGIILPSENDLSTSLRDAQIPIAFSSSDSCSNNSGSTKRISHRDSFTSALQAPYMQEHPFHPSTRSLAAFTIDILNINSNNSNNNNNNTLHLPLESAATGGGGTVPNSASSASSNGTQSEPASANISSKTSKRNIVLQRKQISISNQTS